MSEHGNFYEDAFDRVIKPWWAKIVFGLAMLVLAWLQFGTLTEYEHGKKIHINVGTEFLYTIGGKWLPVGLTAAMGLGGIAWGIVQLSRGVVATGPLQSPLNEIASPAATGEDEAMPYAAAFYHTFYKAIIGAWGLLHIGVGLLLMSAFVDGKPTEYATAVCVILAVGVAFLDAEWIARALRWEAGPIFPTRSLAALFIGGYGLALALAVTLWVNETKSNESAQFMADDARRQKEDMRKITDSDDYKRGVAAMREYQKRQREKAETQPVQP